MICGAGQQHQLLDGAQHDADDDAGQQQPQALLHAAREHQRQQHGGERADEGRAGQAELRADPAGGRRAPDQRKRQRHRQRRARTRCRADTDRPADCGTAPARSRRRGRAAHPPPRHPGCAAAGSPTRSALRPRSRRPATVAPSRRCRPTGPAAPAAPRPGISSDSGRSSVIAAARVASERCCGERAVDAAGQQQRGLADARPGAHQHVAVGRIDAAQALLAQCADASPARPLRQFVGLAAGDQDQRRIGADDEFGVELRIGTESRRHDVAQTQARHQLARKRSRAGRIGPVADLEIDAQPARRRFQQRLRLDDVVFDPLPDRVGCWGSDQPRDPIERAAHVGAVARLDGSHRQAERFEPLEHARRHGGEHQVRTQRDDALDAGIVEAAQPRQREHLHRMVGMAVDPDQPIARPERAHRFGQRRQQADDAPRGFGQPDLDAAVVTDRGRRRLRRPGRRHRGCQQPGTGHEREPARRARAQHPRICPRRFTATVRRSAPRSSPGGRVPGSRAPARCRDRLH